MRTSVPLVDDICNNPTCHQSAGSFTVMIIARIGALTSYRDLMADICKRE